MSGIVAEVKEYEPAIRLLNADEIDLVTGGKAHHANALASVVAKALSTGASDTTAEVSTKTLAFTIGDISIAIGFGFGIAIGVGTGSSASVGVAASATA